MTVTEIIKEIETRRKAMEDKIDEVKKLDNEFQDFLHEQIGITERDKVTPEAILTIFSKLKDHKI